MSEYKVGLGMQNKTVGDQSVYIGSEDIGLAELTRIFWEEKWLIIVVATIFSLAALFYALKATPHFRTEATLYTASDAQLERINGMGLIKIGKKDSAALIYSSLKSNQSLREFFHSQPEIFSYYLDGGASKEEAFANFIRAGISVTLPDVKKDQGKGIFLGLSTVLPEAIDGERLLEEYVRHVLQDVQAGLTQSLTDLVNVKVQRLEKDIDAIFQELEEKRINKIMVLKEARGIAKSLGIVEPVTIASLSTANIQAQGAAIFASAGSRDNALYLYGTKFLDAEILALEMREREEIADNRIPELRSEIARLKALNTQNLSLDGDGSGIYIARIASNPYTSLDKVKPKRSLICVAGGVLGVIFGIFAALFRRLIIKG